MVRVFPKSLQVEIQSLIGLILPFGISRPSLDHFLLLFVHVWEEVSVNIACLGLVTFTKPIFGTFEDIVRDLLSLWDLQV